MTDGKDLYNSVTIKNIDDEDFIFRVNKTPYLLEAGSVRSFPKFIATLGVKHLIDKILNKEDTKTNDKNKRAELASRIVIGERKFDKPEAPTLKETIDELNKPSDLENILAENKKRLQGDGDETLIAPPKVEVDKVESPPVDEPKEEFDGLKKDPMDMTRKEMFEHAKNVMQVDMDDPKVRKTYEKMNKEQLVKEFQLD